MIERRTTRVDSLRVDSLNISNVKAEDSEDTI